jgi:hypothetical protein
MSRNPLAGDVLKLTGERRAYRRRVGNWRILFDLSPGLVEVRYIERRTTTTYRKR